MMKKRNKWDDKFLFENFQLKTKISNQHPKRTGGGTIL